MQGSRRCAWHGVLGRKGGDPETALRASQGFGLGLDARRGSGELAARHGAEAGWASEADLGRLADSGARGASATGADGGWMGARPAPRPPRGSARLCLCGTRLCGPLPSCPRCILHHAVPRVPCVAGMALLRHGLTAVRRCGRRQQQVAARP